MTERHATETIAMKQPELLCDNQSMGEVVTKYIKYPKFSPNTTQSSDWDVIAEIVESLKQLEDSSRPEVAHIKGHQDKHTAYEDLHLRAQLNVQADELAELHLQNHPDIDHTKVPVLPTSGCQIELPKGTLTHNCKLELKNARCAPELQAKLQAKHSWNADIFNDIDWTAHGRALRRHEKHRVTLIKYLHDMLPVGKLVNKMDPKYPPHCPSCACPLETRLHLFYCNNPTRKKWRDNFCTALHKYMDDNNTAMPIQHFVRVVLKALCFAPAGYDQRIPDDPMYQDLKDNQSAIGWREILKGRLTKTFSRIQDEHLGPNRTDRKNGTTWVTGFIDVLFQQWWILWEMRNGDRHGRDLQTKHQATARQTIRELHLFHNKYSSMVDDTHQWLFCEPVTTKEQWPTGVLRQWLNTWEPVLRKSYSTSLETG